MAIPYNPSSFNSNKTILQAIEELKKYLQENPCYKIYMYNDDFVPGTYVYDRSGVDDPDSIEAYDVIFFTNSYYSKVESVGDSTITVWPGIEFVGAEGPQGPAGADGQDGADGQNGVSITNVQINASNHLICTLSDGTTVDAGEIAGSTEHTITLTSSSGTLTDSDYAELGYDNSIIKYTINSVPYLFRKESEDAAQIVFRCIRPHSTDTRIPDFIITKATKGYQYYDSQITISGTSVKSGTASSGQVLTADGDGFANWQTPSGSSPVVVHIASGSSGTFSADDLAKLQAGALIYHDVAKTYYYKFEETASNYTYMYCSSDSSNVYAYKITITISTGAWVRNNYSVSNEGSNLKSTGATSGKVLTADGSGGASWETAGGTTLTRYSLSINATDTLATKISKLNGLLNVKGNVEPANISVQVDNSQSVNIPLYSCNSLTGSNLQIRGVGYQSTNNAMYIISLVYGSGQLNTTASSIIKISLADFTVSALTLSTSQNIITSTSTYYYNNDTQLS